MNRSCPLFCIWITAMAGGRAIAQPAAAPPAVAATPELTEAELAKLAEQEAKTELIVVTGSTIERKSLTTTAPLQVLTRQELLATGKTTLGDILLQLPSQSGGSSGLTNNNGGDGATRISLRGLGSDRTLVLLNGRRMVSSGIGLDTSVDVNTIPLAMVERVEILKDGASSVYGSDAIGGVVNIITRNDFDGSELQLYTGISQHGDARNYDASFVTGHTLGNHKGLLLFSAGFQRQEPVFAGDRSYSRYDRNYDYENHQPVIVGSPSSDSGHLDAFNVDTDGSGVGQRVDLCGAGVRYCASDGHGGFRPYDAAKDQYNYQPASYLATPSTRYNINTSGNYKLTPATSMFFEASFVESLTNQQLAATPFQTLTSGVAISKDSVYNPTGYDLLGYDRRLEEFGPRRTEEDVNTFRIVAGLQGSLPSDLPVVHDWKWEVSYNYGRTHSTNTSTGNLVTSRLAAALGPSFYDDHQVATCGTPDAPIADCVPINILGAAGSIDPKARHYLLYDAVASGLDEEHLVHAITHGRITQLPHGGDISVSVGGDVRYTKSALTPDSLTSAGEGTLSIGDEPTSGSDHVFEGFGELSIVPYTGRGLVKWVELDLAARGFRYEGFGDGSTWKAGGLVRFAEGVALRGTYSTSFRAPSVAELFSRQLESVIPLEDPCDTTPPSAGGATVALDAKTAAGCAKQHVPGDAAFGTSQLRYEAGGNPDLKAERGKTFNVGVVLEPPQVPGLSLTADYWHIDLADSITTTSAASLFSNCYQGGLQAFCDLIHRNPNQGYAIDEIDLRLSNTDDIVTSGLDLSAAYHHAWPRLGRVYATLDTQRAFRYDLENQGRTLHGIGTYDLGFNPQWKGTLSAGLDHPSGWSGGFTVRYLGSLRECEFDDCNDGMASRDVAAWAKLDVFAGYTVKSAAGTTTVTLGVNNASNARPGLLYGGLEGDSDGGAYDLIGRLIYVRLQQGF